MSVESPTRASPPDCNQRLCDLRLRLRLDQRDHIPASASAAELGPQRSRRPGGGAQPVEFGRGDAHLDQQRLVLVQQRAQASDVAGFDQGAGAGGDGADAVEQGFVAGGIRLPTRRARSPP